MDQSLISSPGSGEARQPHQPFAHRLKESLDRLAPRLVTTLRQLVRTPSENIPPRGGERVCQLQIADWLKELGIEPDVYDVTDAPGLCQHAEFWPGRDYSGRPNVNGRIRGAGGGRSLVLSGHVDTVPVDSGIGWRHSPFEGEIENGRLFGRGAWDMKAGVAMNLTVIRALRESGISLLGDVIFETVVDEEFGGANGTLAARLRGYNADAAVIGEPTSLRICPAQRGGRTLHVSLNGDGGIFADSRPPARVVDQLTYILGRLPEFKEHRKMRVPVHPYYANCAEPFAVWVTNIATGLWGWVQPISVPARCRLELYWQAMPDETREEVEGEFHQWWTETIAGRPDLFPVAPGIEWPMRWLPGCSILPDSPLVTEFTAACAAEGAAPLVEGMDAPSDMYVFQKCFNTPAIMWGPSGGGAHQADEYVELDSLITATSLLAHFVCRWCGVKESGS